MLTYLLHASIIWSLSLCCFELFLKKETYHGMNRTYLLFTLLLGLLVPLWSWPQAGQAYTIVLRQPLYHQPIHAAHIMTHTRETVINKGIPIGTLLYTFYLAGVAISLVPIVREVIILFYRYRRGTKHYENKWIISETGKQHSPFSLFNILFVNNRFCYSSDEWELILKHEEQHRHLLHFADLFLMRMLQVVFWFHPLIYAYKNRLLLIHEYQADATVSETKQLQYGRFIIEQSMLQGAPSVTHSLSRAPIAKRLRMMTRRSSDAAHFIKLLTIVPLVSFAFLCCTKPQESTRHLNKKGTDEIVVQDGNRIQFHLTSGDTLLVKNPETHATEKVILNSGRQPVTANDQKIFSNGEVNIPPVYSGIEKSLATLILKEVAPELSLLPDGTYTTELSRIILNTQGRVIYHDNFYIVPETGNLKVSAETPGEMYHGLLEMRHSLMNAKDKMIPPSLQQVINKKADNILKQANFTPAMKDGKNVYYNLESPALECNLVIRIKDHHIIPATNQ
ncbi:M56 family metallopeptidase [Chitinophagaceae bacterium MMS25-I14]